MIRRLEQAGLGYHIQADATVDKLGNFFLALSRPALFFFSF